MIHLLLYISDDSVLMQTIGILFTQVASGCDRSLPQLEKQARSPLLWAIVVQGGIPSTK